MRACVGTKVYIYIYIYIYIYRERERERERGGLQLGYYLVYGDE